MAIKAPDINAEYLQVRNIEIVRGDTFGFSIRMLYNGQPKTLTENEVVTFCVLSVGKTPVITKHYNGDVVEQDQDGYINIALTPAETLLLKKTGSYTYELEWFTNSNTIYTLLKGNIKLIDTVISDEHRG